MSDIEKLKIEKEYLEKQLLWYKSFFVNATDAVFIVQPETWAILDVNEFATNLLNKSREELLGSIQPQFRRIFKLLKKSSSPIVLSELSFENGNNNLMLEVSARFIEFENQKLILAIARDVSEQHALTDKLVQADKLVLLGQLSAGVAHEIRNPLAAINLNLQVLKRKFQPEDPEFTYIQNALQGVDRISRIVELTLNFSKPAIPDIQNINLNNVVTSALELVASSIRRKEITVELKLDENLPLVSADFKQIQQLLINLLTNACDAIKAEGKIIIRSYIEKSQRKDHNDYVVLSIQDNGIGIMPEDMPKIFNPFFTRKSDGTGLGLPISQRIIHQHNGVIDVESIYGKGTIFYVKLPKISEKIN